MVSDCSLVRIHIQGVQMKRYQLMWSIVASFSGEHPDLSEYWPCEVTLSDVIRDWPGDKPEPSEPFDSEYNYLAREGGIPRKILDRLEEASGGTKFQICRKLKELYPRESFWACISDIQVSGILDRKTLFEFLDDIGAIYEDCETMGTLGGPLSIGIVPDFPFHVESQALISSIRITPILCKQEGEEWIPCRAPNEDQWERIKEVLSNEDAYRIAKGEAFGKEMVR